MKFVDFPHEDTFDYGLLRTCKNCHQEFTGRYCNRCGEKVIVPEDRSLPELFKKTFSTIPILDNRFTRTIRLMLTKTGYVSRNYIIGRRRPFIDPLAIFLVINLLYFLFPTFQTYHTPLRTQTNFLLHSKIASEMVEERIANESTTLPEFTVLYDQHATNVAKILLVGFVLILAIPFWMVNYSAGMFFRDHLVTSIEFCTVSILINNLVIPWLWFLIASVFSRADLNADSVFEGYYPSLLLGVISFALFYTLEKRVYLHSSRQSIFYSALMLTGLFLSLHLYYGMVFFISMWTL
jgi:hypothetical protein